MRVLIIGEFSSFAKNLSKGLCGIGHECFVFSWGDGFKKIGQDEQTSYQIDLRNYQVGDGLIKAFTCRFHNYLEFLRLRKFVAKKSEEEKWDSILIVNPAFIQAPHRFWQCRFTRDMIESLAKNRENIYLSACGGDLPYFEYWSQHKWKNVDVINHHKASFLSKSSFRHFKSYTKYIKKVIPVMYCYAEAWRKSEVAKGVSVLKTIHLPVDCSAYAPNNVIADKVVVFHGIIRPINKGTKYIKAAMERLQKDYPEIVECRADGGMPLNEYLEVLDRTNILIDQALSDYTGMNGLYGLAMGKVVFAGNEPETREEFGEKDIPIININPDADQIYDELVKIITDKDKILALSKASREYVERVHDAKVVAQQYVELFEKYNS